MDGNPASCEANLISGFYSWLQSSTGWFLIKSLHFNSPFHSIPSIHVPCNHLSVLCSPATLVTWLSHAINSANDPLLFVPFLFPPQPSFAGHHKCRELWPPMFVDYERSYNVLLMVLLLVVPLFVLASTYSLITRSLWQGMRTERALKKHLAAGNAPVNDAQSSRCLSGWRLDVSL